MLVVVVVEFYVLHQLPSRRYYSLLWFDKQCGRVQGYWSLYAHCQSRWASNVRSIRSHKESLRIVLAYLWKQLSTRSYESKKAFRNEVMRLAQGYKKSFFWCESLPLNINGFVVHELQCCGAVIRRDSATPWDRDFDCNLHEKSTKINPSKLLVEVGAGDYDDQGHLLGSIFGAMRPQCVVPMAVYGWTLHNSLWLTSVFSSLNQQTGKTSWHQLENDLEQLWKSGGGTAVLVWVRLQIVCCCQPRLRFNTSDIYIQRLNVQAQTRYHCSWYYDGEEPFVNRKIHQRTRLV